MGFSLLTNNMRVLRVNKTKTKVSRIFKKKIVDFQKFSKIEFWWSQIFENLIIHKPSPGSREFPQKILAWSVQPFWRLLDTNKQTDNLNLYIDSLYTWYQEKGDNLYIVLLETNVLVITCITFINIPVHEMHFFS